MGAHPVLSASGLAFPFLFKSIFCSFAQRLHRFGQSLFSRISNGAMLIKVCFYPYYLAAMEL